MEISVNHLILEVTRKCNMCCDHCLRGDAQSINMTRHMIDQILNRIDHIGCITFTGGEPTLNLPIIRYFFEQAKELDKLPSSFWIATNGKEHQLELASLLMEYFPLMDEPEMCGVAMSSDIYHDMPKINYLKGLAFYDTSKEHDSNDYESWVMKTGRAEELGIGDEKSLTRRAKELYVDTYGDNVDIDEMYINVHGFILPNCDLSYEEQEDMKICHLDDIKEYFKKFMKAENTA